LEWLLANPRSNYMVRQSGILFIVAELDLF
jgi:hypothetical protein